MNKMVKMFRELLRFILKLLRRRSRFLCVFGPFHNVCEFVSIFSLVAQLRIS